jgi:hypothetical protein
VDAPGNGTYLAETAADRIPGVSDDLPVHSGSHPKYNDLARLDADTALSELIDQYGDIKKIPPNELTEAVLDVQETMWSRLEKWITTHGDKLK